MLDTFQLAERARFLEDNGARVRADLLRETLERRNCCTECGSKLVFEEEFIMNMAIICALYAMVTSTKAPLA